MKSYLLHIARAGKRAYTRPCKYVRAHMLGTFLFLRVPCTRPEPMATVCGSPWPRQVHRRCGTAAMVRWRRVLRERGGRPGTHRPVLPSVGSPFPSGHTDKPHGNRRSLASLWSTENVETGRGRTVGGAMVLHARVQKSV